MKYDLFLACMKIGFKQLKEQQGIDLAFLVAKHVINNVFYNNDKKSYNCIVSAYKDKI